MSIQASRVVSAQPQGNGTWTNLIPNPTTNGRIRILELAAAGFGTSNQTVEFKWALEGAANAFGAMNAGVLPDVRRDYRPGTLGPPGQTLQMRQYAGQVADIPLEVTATYQVEGG